VGAKEGTTFESAMEADTGLALTCRWFTDHASKTAITPPSSVTVIQNFGASLRGE
jgi:hypothetical protein